MSEYKLWLAKILTLAFVVLFFLMVPVLIGGVSQVALLDGPPVAVVQLEGEIHDATDVLKALYKQAADKDTKAIVLRIDSPGGAVAPSEEIYNAVKRLKAEKPIVVSMGSVAASGGLYSAVSASKVFCQPGTQTGSIGVIMQIPNFTSIADKVGFSMVTVKSGAMKDAGNPFRSMTDQERAYLEETAHRVHTQFIRAVAEGRNINEAKVRSFADGRVILGVEAKELGLVDDFGDIYDAARAALALANVPVKDGQLPRLVYANKKPTILEKLLDPETSLKHVMSEKLHWSMQYLAY